MKKILRSTGLVKSDDKVESCKRPEEIFRKQPNNRSHKVNLDCLIEFIRSNEKYESKGQQATAIAQCELILQNSKNRSDYDLIRNVTAKKLELLNRKTSKHIKSSVRSQSIDKKNDKTNVSEELTDPDIIEFIKGTILFIERMRGQNKKSKQITHDYIEFVCNQKLRSANNVLARTRLLDCLAFAFVEKGDYENAISLSNQAIYLRTQSYDSNHLEMVISFSTKSYAYYSMKQYVQAIELIRKSIEIKEHILTENHLLTKIEKTNLTLVISLLERHQKDEHNLVGRPVMNEIQQTFYLTQLDDLH